MAGRTHSKQICVFKTQKTLIEFMDDTRYEKEPKAWPFAPTSRIRLQAKDYSEGIGERAVDAFFNLSFDDFTQLSVGVQRMRSSISSDYNRVKKQLDRLVALRQSRNPDDSMKNATEIADQFASSSNELFSEAGVKLKEALSKANINQETDASLDKMIGDLTAELEEIAKSKEIYSEIKILNYDQYANPENPEERRITSLKVVFMPRMNNPFVVTVGNGWGLPVVLRSKGVGIQNGSVRLVDVVRVSMDEANMLILLKRVEMFLQAMTNCALQGYFEAVTNPVLSYEMTHNEK